MRFRLGVDGRAMEGSVAGIGRYIFEICRVLEQELPDFDLYIYSRKPIVNCELSGRWIRRTDKSWWAGKLKSVIWLKLRLPALARQDNLDVFWGGATFLPALPRRVKTISTVHDINHLLVPWSMPWATLWAYRLFFRSDVLRANLVTANSSGTARRLQEKVGRAPSIIARPGVGPAFHVPCQEEADAALSRLAVRRPFILALSTIEPRKNLGLLIDAYSALRLEGQLDGRELIIAGAKGWGTVAIPAALPDWIIREIRFIGFVPNEALPCLFSAAELFVFPSVYEGYGMPVAEAVACGARILATEMPELREAGGDAAVYVAANLGSLKEGILDAISRTRPSAASRLDRRVTWEMSGRKLAEGVRQLCGTRVSRA